VHAPAFFAENPKADSRFSQTELFELTKKAAGMATFAVTDRA
jgi:hypothetical protein